ncbi:3-deoxy-D-manno-octulosonic acid transferase [Rhodobacter calidifons]|uniref:3-deoxy-D-manno-octulosonic acid transferase n=1 Tax=Rhodobacter calidifons TaxID=2715277 RepID=A0ABX0G2V5_9RHOB|nr:glycosyltransferase N-terminal domain-containing protein [Rhodobacter calidifons]NHB75196.1 3-deoxy-D-manno-octulosonic acid transferase [Rhodobacter calidifons]
MRLWVFLRLWSALWHLGLPVVLAYLWWRGRKDPLYARHIGERFGRHAEQSPGAVWVHAVSLGELRSAVPLIRALLDRGERVVTTHFTPAGRREADRVFAADIAAGRLTPVWVPLETSWAYAGFFDAFRPKLGLVMEIEIWPRMILSARRAGVPLYLCNAQYPSDSMARDARLGIRPALMRLCTGALVKSGLQAQRLAAVGVPNLTVTGELRFDQPIPAEHLKAAGRLRPTLGPRRVIAFASVTEPEEALFIAAAQEILSVRTPPVILFIPRAPERFDAVARALAAKGVLFDRRSTRFDHSFAPRSQAPMDVLLCDSLGEMYFYLGLADRVVVGGGFQPKGSHNIIEPLALRKPVLVGPQIQTIEYPAVEAIAAGVCHQTTADRLVQDVLAWPDPDPEAISAFMAAHSGATRRTLAALEPLLSDPDSGLTGKNQPAFP